MTSESKPITADDPRLTAYALGELQGEERVAVLAALKSDPKLLEEVDALQKLGLMLEDELGAEPAPELSEEARAEIERAAGSPPSPARDASPRGASAAPAPAPAGRVIPFWRRPSTLSAAAAVLVGGLGLSLTVSNFKSSLNHAFVKGGEKIQEDIVAQMDGDSAPQEVGDVPAERPLGEISQHMVDLQRLEAPPESAPGDDAATTPEPAPAKEIFTLSVPDPAGPAPVEKGRLDHLSNKNLDSTNAVDAYGVGGGGGPAGRWTKRRAEERERLRELRRALEMAEQGSPGASSADLAARLELAQRTGAATGWADGDRTANEERPNVHGLPGDEAQDAPAVGFVTLNVQPQETSDVPFKAVADAPLSTFSIDVDTASYSLVRRFLKRATWPNPDRVRVEEMINYFPYDYAPPKADAEHPFAVHTEVADCPWAPGQQLVRVALKGREIDLAQRPTSNLVFLIDVSGSMSSPGKLPLLRKSLRLLVEQLGENDRVAIVVYAGASGLALPSTSASDKDAIVASLDRLSAGGSTNGGAGLQLAYEVAVENFVEGGTNRVILCTDGDFNVGVASRDGLVRMIQDKAKSGVFLSVMGFGMRGGDRRMESLADKGNGQYAYIDDFNEAKKVFVQELGGTLVAIAKDVKIQVEFNPLHVESYRLIGYANRRLRAQDFADDTKDAGEIGAGHTVTAFYQLVPCKAQAEKPEGELKYQKRGRELTPAADSDELLTVKLRYKQPDADTSVLMSTVVKASGKRFWDASQDFRFAGSVAAFGMLLRSSPHAGKATLDLVEEIAIDSAGSDAQGYRREFLQLVRNAKKIARRK